MVTPVRFNLHNNMNSAHFHSTFLLLEYTSWILLALYRNIPCCDIFMTSYKECRKVHQNVGTLPKSYNYPHRHISVQSFTYEQTVETIITKRIIKQRNIIYFGRTQNFFFNKWKSISSIIIHGRAQQPQGRARFG